MTEPLFSDPPRPVSAVGPVEAATRRSLAAANLDAEAEGAGAALLALAWALDAARAAGKFYGVAQAGPPYQALWERILGGKEQTGDGLDAWLAGLTAPTLGDGSQP